MSEDSILRQTIKGHGMPCPYKNQAIFRQTDIESIVRLFRGNKQPVPAQAIIDIDKIVKEYVNGRCYIR
jgi:hypothetical protein